SFHLKCEFDHAAGGKIRNKNADESWELSENLTLYDHEGWNDTKEFAKPVKAISLLQDVPINKITASFEICIGPHDTQYCMEDPEQAFVEYASSRTNEAGEGLVSNSMASQDARLTKFKADFKQQQSEMTNKIELVLKAITDRIAGALPSDMIKNPKLITSLVLFARSYPTEDPQCSTHIYGSINSVTIHPKQQSDSHDDRTKENEEEEKVRPENIDVNPSMPPDLSVSFISKKVLKLNSFFESLSQAGEHKVEYFDIFLTRSELAYHKYLMCGPIPLIFLRNPIITERCPSNLKIPCNIGYVHVEKAYIDPNSPLSIMTQMMYNLIMRRKFNPRENLNRGVSNFTGRINEMHVFVGNFTYIVDFMIVENISSIIDPRLSQVVLGKPFVEISNMTHDPPEEHTKSVYLRNEEDIKRGLEYVMSKILGFYKECLELGPEYVTGIDDEGEVTLYLKRRSLEDLRMFSLDDSWRTI
ncbi:hypothetical protein Tco_0184454, partial [Tanacetum coccineum]